MKQEIGRFYGIGVGPGDPGLVTLKARRILSTIPVVFVPKKGKESASFAKSIIADFITAGQEVVELVFPMVRERDRLEDSWQKAAGNIWSYLKQGKDCALVNLGDPLLYGTFIPVAETLRRQHPEVTIESIPGISSINAAAAEALIPLASEDETVAVISGNRDDNFIRETLNRFDTVVFMKINSGFERVLGIIEELDLVSKCVYVKRCSTQDREIVRDVSRLKDEKLDYLSLLIFRR